MADADERDGLLRSLQDAIDAVPEEPGVRDDAPDDGAGVGRVDGGPGIAGEVDDGQAAAIRDASKRAYAILALRDHSRVELRKKLVDRGHEERIVEVLLGKLEDAGLVDDARFAEQFVRSQRTRQGRSLSAISRALREKGVSDDDARSALDDLTDDFPFALEAARKKAASTRGLARDVRMRRVLGVLGRRGFDGSTARRAAAQALEGEDDSTLI